MKLFIVFILFIVSSISLFANEEKLKIGIMYEKLFTTKKEAKIGSELWLKQMQEKDKNFKLEMIFYKDEKRLLDDYINKKISVIVSNAISYYENKKIIDSFSNHKWVMSLSEGIFDKFYLIKNRELKFDLESLKNKKIYYKNEMAKIWLDSLIFKEKKKSIIKKYTKIEKANKLIFNIFFNKNELSIISKDTYESMLELNPQIKQKIEIVSESEAMFFDGIGFTRKDICSEFEKMLELMRIKLVKKEKEFDVLSFVDIQKVYILKNNDLDKLDRFYKDYSNLKKIYK
ncbi:hypothetical protein [Arcobacter sp. LA11]|uniref:hypothetical protein n=1 Tax=Arcobacter sp. LA11 TaxID=1898176 RepID=UPI00093312B7|nr:hypothetical protein [Arcobacter sp. LA11]